MFQTFSLKRLKYYCGNYSMETQNFYIKIGKLLLISES